MNKLSQIRKEFEKFETFPLSILKLSENFLIFTIIQIADSRKNQSSHIIESFFQCQKLDTSF